MNNELLLKVWRMMCYAHRMAEVYDENRAITKYVHSTSRGHEAIQLATAFHLQSYDYVSPYYRDESLLLGLGFTPYELMLQLLAKEDDYFSGGRTYYSHPSSRRADMPLIPHQSSATGMQTIPATGMAQGIDYLIKNNLLATGDKNPVVVCSLGDGSVTEGEVAEAFQFAALKQLPIIYLVQDNEWGISATAEESRSMNAYEYAAGFKGIQRITVDGSRFETSFEAMRKAFNYVRNTRKPVLVHASVPLLGHHTSGVRKEWYRSEEELTKAAQRDPYHLLRAYLLSEGGIAANELDAIELDAIAVVNADFIRATEAAEPKPESVFLHDYAASPVTEEVGTRCPEGKEKVVMVDAALHAVEEILASNPDAILFGQDVGRRLGGVFREAATLADKFGDQRVFNTAIQEAYIVGSTAGLSAVGVKPIVEIQFADYIWTGFNQLVVELAKSCYLTMGKFPVQALIRVPIGAYGSGGPYHSGSIEATLTTIKGIKVVYPSNAADLKGLMKAAFLDPNPVIMLEHKGLYWSKVPGTEDAKTVEPASDYMIPLSKATTYLAANETELAKGNTICVITYGMGVHWSKNAAQAFPGQVEIVDLRTLFPMDEAFVYERVKAHGKCLLVTEEPELNSFIETVAGRISRDLFQHLDAAVKTIGAKNLPAVCLNSGLEKAMLPNVELVQAAMKSLLEE
jgi:2-oxoisovalerate dehydrogenase E1 component